MSNRKRMISLCVCCLLLIIFLVAPKYQRISFNQNTLGGELPNHIDSDTIVANDTQGKFPTQLPIYRITKHNISDDEFQQLLQQLDISDISLYENGDFELNGNSIFISLVDFTDFSRGYFDMTDEELEKLAWETFNKIPFMQGEYEYLGIKDTFKVSDINGTYISRAGVSFCRLLDGVRVVGEEDCIIYFDGSGLVGIRIKLFNYTRIGIMNMVTIEDAAAQIKTPDAFSIEADTGIADTLQVDRIKLLLVNQHSDGCTILQPIYNFIGTATMEDGSKSEFSSKVIAIPEYYTYEKTD